MHKPPQTVLLLVLAAALAGAAQGQTLTPDQVISPPTGGAQNFIEFVRIIPSMNDMLKSVMLIMANLDVPGLADTIARVLAGIIALGSFALGWLNYAYGKRVSFAGMDGSFSNMLLAGVTVLMISTGLPRVLGEAGWALWRVTYTNVETRVNPTVDKLIQDRTSRLAVAVWDYAATGLSAGVQPMVTAAQYFQGNLDIDRAGAAGQPYREAAARKVEEAKKKNGQYGGIWQFGSLLIASMFMAYIGIILGSGLFVLFTAVFLPVSFAMLSINASVLLRSLGGMVSSIIVAGLAPGLMMANIIIVFDGPINYMTRMMENKAIAAADNADALQTMMQACVSKAQSDPGILGAVKGAAANAVSAVNPMDTLMNNVCVVGAATSQAMFTMSQSALYIILGLVVAGALFVGLSGLAGMIFRELKQVIDGIFATGGGLGNGGSGRGHAFAGAAMNRVAGAAMALGGAATGNAQLAAAGARSVASGRDAAGGAIGALRENAMDRQRRSDGERREQTRKDEQKQRDADSDRKHEERRDEGRDYANKQYEERQAALRAEREAEQRRRDEERAGQREKGEGSRTDPRSATSGGQHAQEPDGGAVNSDPDLQGAGPQTTGPEHATTDASAASASGPSASAQAPGAAPSAEERAAHTGPSFTTSPGPAAGSPATPGAAPRSTEPNSAAPAAPSGEPGAAPHATSPQEEQASPTSSTAATEEQAPMSDADIEARWSPPAPAAPSADEHQGAGSEAASSPAPEAPEAGPVHSPAAAVEAPGTPSDAQTESRWGPAPAASIPPEPPAATVTETPQPAAPAISDAAIEARWTSAPQPAPEAEVPTQGEPGAAAPPPPPSGTPVDSAPQTNTPSTTATTASGAPASGTAPQPDVQTTSRTSAAPSAPTGSTGPETGRAAPSGTTPPPPAAPPAAGPVVTHQATGTTPAVPTSPAPAAPGAPLSDAQVTSRWEGAAGAPATSAPRSQPLSEPDREKVQEMYQRVNEQAAREAQEGQPPRYISPEQVQWGMQRQGLLPSQQAQTQQQVDAYVQAHGGTPEAARSTLEAQGQLPHQQLHPQPRPASYPTEEAWKAAQPGGDTTRPETP